MIGENLKKIREEKNISKLQLSKSSGITRQNILSIERGERTNVKLETITSLAKALKVDVADLIK